MPILKIEKLGQYGILDDPIPSQLPPNAWSNGKNVRFNDGKVVKFRGHETFFTPSADWDGGGVTNTTDQIYFLLPVAEGNNYYWIYCGLNDVAVYDSSTGNSTEITRVSGNYTATDASVDWTGCIIGGVPVINNGVDTPQQWATVDPSTTKLTDLTGFAASADKCGALRAYKNYLVAMDVTKSGVRYASLVKWSDSSALGSVPTSWDENDATTDAGETELAGTRSDVNVGICLDGMALRDSFIIYKDDSIWSMNFVGGTFVFEFRKIYSAQGMLARRCMAEFEGQHFVVGQADVFVHDGANFKSVIDTKLLEELFKSIDPTYYDRTFVYANYAYQEMWVCFVENASGYTWPNKAFVWNWRHETWGTRDLPVVTAYIDGGIVNSQDITDIWSNYDGGTGTHDGANDAAVLTDTGASWTIDEHVDRHIYNTTDGSVGLITANTSDTITAALSGGTDNDWDTGDGYGIAYTWDDWGPTDEWGSLGFTPQAASPCMACTGVSYKGDTSKQFAGSNMTSYVIRCDIPLGEQDQFMRIKAAYPRMQGDHVEIRIGSQLAPGCDVDWGNLVKFTPSVDQKIDVRKTGTHAAIEIYSDDNVEWEISGIDIEFEQVSRR